MLASTLALMLILFYAYESNAQTTLIATNASWKYLANGSNQGTAWRGLSFVDTSWPSGAAELGFGDSPTTKITSGKINYYFRKSISISNPAIYSGYVLKIRRDDGIVVYVNGVEVYRNNMPSGTINYNTPASSNCSDDGSSTYTVNLPVSYFIPGNNVVAAEVHNSSASSSDITFVLQLIGNPLPCLTPNMSLAGADSIKMSSARIYWTPVSGAVSYNLKYRKKNIGASYSSAINSTTSPIILSNLQPNVTYEFTLQTVCSGNSTSSVSASKSFITLANSCATPNVSLFGTINKTSVSAEVYWTPITDAASYNVRYRIRNIGASYSAPINTSSTSLVLANLQPSTNYEFTVQTLCSDGLQSAVSSSGIFTTLAPPPQLLLTRGPYMTTPSRDSINIQWRTNIVTDSKVKFGVDVSTLNDSVIDTIPTVEHTITLKNLLPNTKYFYSIGTTSSTLQGDLNNYFYTAPNNNEKDPLKFWVIGDFGMASTVQTNVRNSFTNYTAGQKINGWIWVGDNAYATGTDAEYQAKVFNIYPSQFKNIPVFPSPGNHDYASSGYLSANALGLNFPYFYIFNLPKGSGTEKYYSTDYGNVHFISLDSYGSYNTSSSAMYQWLLNDLTNNTQQWTVVYFHHPPFTKGSHNSDIDIESVNTRTNLVPLLESFGVDLVLSGHSHNYERSYFIKNHFGLDNTFNPALFPAGNIVQEGGGPYFKYANRDSGTVYVVCGVSGEIGTGTSPGFPHDAMFTSINNIGGSLILDIKGDTLSCSFLTTAGSINDQFSIIKTIPPPSELRKMSSFNFISTHDVSIYPNPSDGKYHIQINKSVKGPVDMTLVDVHGKIIFKESFLKSEDEELIIEKENSDLPREVYFLKINGDIISFSTRLIIY